MNEFTAVAMIFFLCVLLFIVLIAMFFACYIFWQTVRAHVYNNPPYLPVANSILDKIVLALNVQSGDVLFDLGCGDGRVLAAALKAEPSIHAIGIDYDPLIVWRAKRKLSKQIQQGSAQIIHKDIFVQDYKSANVIFTYLLSDFMDRLLPKLQNELKPRTRLVSCDFKFTKKEPIEVIDLKRSGMKLGRYLYVYQF